MFKLIFITVFTFCLSTHANAVEELSCGVDHLMSTSIGDELSRVVEQGPSSLWETIDTEVQDLYTGPRRISLFKILQGEGVQVIEQQRVDFSPPITTSEPYGKKEYLYLKTFTETESKLIFKELQNIVSVTTHSKPNGLKILSCGKLVSCTKRGEFEAPKCEAQVGKWIQGQVTSL